MSDQPTFGLAGLFSKSRPHVETQHPGRYRGAWEFAAGERKCDCGHGEGMHMADGHCLMRHKCSCAGLRVIL